MSITPDEASIRERLSALEAKINILGAIATAALALNCAFLGAVIVLLIK